MKLHGHGASSPKGLRDDTVAAERGRSGGVKFGSAFLGWMTARGYLYFSPP